MDTGLQTKKPWQSKTLWLGVFAALAPLFPPVQEFINQNPSTYGWIVTGLFTGLRLITKGQITIT